MENKFLKKKSIFTGMKKLRVVYLFIPLLLLWSCSGGYSFTGMDAGQAQSFSVKTFPNYAPLVNPSLSLQFTENLKQMMMEQTPLELHSSGGDLRFEGSITGYSVQPISAQQEQAAQNRLSITVKVTFTNTLDESKNYEQKFTRYREYDASLPLSDVETQLVLEINDELAEDILNKAIGGW